MKPCVRQRLSRWRTVLGLVVKLDQGGHEGGDGVRVDRFSPTGCEDEAVRLLLCALPGLADLQLVGELALAVSPKNVDRSGIDADHARPSALGRPLDALAGDERGRALDVHGGVVEVDVPPPQVEQFPTSRAGIRGQVEEREQPVGLGDLQEGPKLRSRPNVAGFGRTPPGTLRTFDRVRRDHLLDKHGVSESLAKHRMDVGNGSRREPSPVTSTRGDEVAVELGDLTRPDGL